MVDALIPEPAPDIAFLTRAEFIDDEYKMLINAVRSQLIPSELQEFDRVFPKLVVENNAVFFNNRLVVPRPGRAHVLSELHRAHQGLTKTSILAKAHFYWPFMANGIKQIIESCQSCSKYVLSTP